VTETIETPILAIDVGGTKIAMGTVVAGRLIRRRQFPTPRTGRGDDLVKSILAAVDKTDMFEGIAIATTGIVADGRLSALNPETLPIENEFPLADAIKAATGTKPIVVNDAQAAAWGEFRFGAGRGCASFAFVTVSTGIGAGIVADGRLLVGRSGLSGHLGHAVCDPRGEPCGCGRRGCLEAMASGNALARRGSALLGRSVTAPKLFAEAAEGNHQAEALLDEASVFLASAFADLTATCDVDRIALGGGVGMAEGFLVRVQKRMAGLPLKYQREVCPATAGADAGLLGVADLAIEEIFRH
jgi:N-acylmannosamine kinase